MKFKDLKISAQLIIGFAVMLILVILLGVVSYRQSDQIHLQTETMYNHSLQVRSAVGRLETNILNMRFETRNLMLATTNEERQNALNNMEASEERAFQQFDILTDRYLGSKKDVDEASNAFNKWNIAREENTRLALTGNTDKVKESVSLMGKVGALRSVLAEKITKIDDSSSRKASALYADSNQLKNFLDAQLILLLSAIIILSIILSYYLIQNKATWQVKQMF